MNEIIEEMTGPLESQLSNGNWVVCNNVIEVIQAILDREAWYAPRVKRTPMTTREEVLECLASGKALRYGDDWYENIRVQPAPVPVVSPKLILCDCGHECEEGLVMMASLGTSCSDCYDRMAD